jgi:hypothetical protein
MERVKGSKEAPLLAEIHKNGAKNVRFPALFGLKIAENAVFSSKVLIKIYSEYVFSGKHYFKIFCYLRRCGNMPVQSFGSHILPQPSGLG